MYPEYAEIDGKEYKIDTSFKTAIRCFEINDDKTISDNERSLAIIYLLFGFIPKDNIQTFFEKAILFLQCGKSNEEQRSQKKDMDFTQDRSYIVSSFMNVYHMNLNDEDIHFWYFIELIQGLDDRCILNKVREIRNYDISQLKDEKERSRILRMKQDLALEQDQKQFTKEEEEAMNKFDKLAGI